MTNSQLLWRVVGAVLCIAFLPWIAPLLVIGGIFVLIANACSDDVWGGR